MRDPRKALFPLWSTGGADWLLAIAVLTSCFFIFYHGDIYVTGWSSLNYLFGSPMEFYENSKVFVGGGESMLGTGYLPPIYVISAFALCPLKLFGLLTGPEHFPAAGVYLIKAVLTGVYLLSGWTFYRITAFYSADSEWRKFATAAYMTSPILIFTQFVFSQYDIFYILLTLVGYGLILQRRIFMASAVFGLAVTFKSFPIFVYLPLLLLVEKRIVRLAASGLLLILPTALLLALYWRSPAFVEGVIGNPGYSLVFVAGIDLGGWKIMFLCAGLSILCGWNFLASPSHKQLVPAASFTFLAGSILPFLFLNWHPQWLASIMPAVVLTSMSDRRWQRFLLLDLAGMAFFLATTVTFFPRIEQGMVHLRLLRASELSGWSMGALLDLFGDRSASVYSSLFWGYLVLQLLAKARPLPMASLNLAANTITLRAIRVRLLGGLAIFILPLLLTACLSRIHPLRDQINVSNEIVPGGLFGARVFEQTMIGSSGLLRTASLFLGTYSRENSGILTLELLDADGTVLAASQVASKNIHDNAWCPFHFKDIPLTEGVRYRLRLTAADSREDNAVTWYASKSDKYPGGQAVVDGRPCAGDFTLRLEIIH